MGYTKRPGYLVTLEPWHARKMRPNNGCLAIACTNHARLGDYPFPKQTLVFTQLWYTSLLKTPWEIGEFSAIFIKFEIVVCKLFQLGRF